MNNYDEFFKSLADSNRAFANAILREEQTGFDDFEATLDRKYEEGFIDGMRHAYILLTGDTLDSPTTDIMEKEIRAEYRDDPLTTCDDIWCEGCENNFCERRCITCGQTNLTQFKCPSDQEACIACCACPEHEGITASETSLD